MKNISKQYQDLLEGKMSQAQFLRNARMMFPNFVTNHNSFDDSVKILKTKGMLSEGDAVKGTPDKEPTYDALTPDDKIKYKKVEQSPEVDEQNGIYPATTITDIPKEKTYKKVKNESDGLEPIKDNDTKNEMKKVKVVKENIAPEEIENAEVEITTNDSSIQAMADKMGISQEELFKLLLKKGGLQMIKSYLYSKLKLNASACIRLICFAYGLKSKFCLASTEAISSISMASICSEKLLWANIRDIIPVPAPMSSMLYGLLIIGVQAPNKTPSVPTFMADFSCSTENCLNEKIIN